MNILNFFNIPKSDIFWPPPPPDPRMNISLWIHVFVFGMSFSTNKNLIYSNQFGVCIFLWAKNRQRVNVDHVVHILKTILSYLFSTEWLSTFTIENPSLTMNCLRSSTPQPAPWPTAGLWDMLLGKQKNTLYGKWDCAASFPMLAETSDDMLGSNATIYPLGFKTDFNSDKTWLGLGRSCNTSIRIITSNFSFRLEYNKSAFRRKRRLG